MATETIERGLNEPSYEQLKSEVERLRKFETAIRLGYVLSEDGEEGPIVVELDNKPKEDVT